jgi:hypothetical protein
MQAAAQAALWLRVWLLLLLALRHQPVHSRCAAMLPLLPDIQYKSGKIHFCGLI